MVAKKPSYYVSKKLLYKRVADCLRLTMRYLDRSAAPENYEQSNLYAECEAALLALRNIPGPKPRGSGVVTHEILE